MAGGGGNQGTRCSQVVMRAPCVVICGGFGDELVMEKFHR